MEPTIGTPQRIQLRRTKGWRMPANTKKVDRTTLFGNPFSPKYVLEQAALAGEEMSFDEAKLAGYQLFKQALADRSEMVQPHLTNLEKLRGKNLACWCKPGGLCHAELLLALANEESPVEAADELMAA